MLENEFEKKVQQKLDALQVQPTDEVWQKIKVQVAQKKQKNRRGSAEKDTYSRFRMLVRLCAKIRSSRIELRDSNCELLVAVTLMLGESL